MADSSFDIVSKVDHQEVDNALNQAAKEISQRYDFKNVGASIAWSGEAIVMKANSRGAGQGRPRRLPGEAHQARHLAQGARRRRAQGVGQGVRARRRRSRRASRQENAKKLGKLIRDEGPKSVKVRVEGDELQGLLEVPRRPAGRQRPGQGQRPRLRGAVRQLPLSRTLLHRRQFGIGAVAAVRHGLEAGDPLRHRRVRREQLRMRPSVNGLAIISALVVCSRGSGGSGAAATPALELAQRAGQGQRVAGERRRRTRRPGTRASG